MDARDFVRTAHALSVPCQLDVPFEDKMSDRGVLKKPNKQKTPQYFTPAPERIQFWLLNILDILYSWQHLLYVKQMSGLSLVCLEMTLLSMSFKKKKKSRGEVLKLLSHWPAHGPWASHQIRHFPLPPCRPPRLLTKWADFWGGVYRPYPQCGTLWAKPQWFYPWNIHVLYFYIFGKHLSVSLTCFIHNPHCLLSIFVLGFFWGCRQSHHS